MNLVSGRTTTRTLAVRVPIVSPSGVPAVGVVWEAPKGGTMLTAVAKITFDLRAPVCSIASSHEPLRDDTADIVPSKDRCELFLTATRASATSAPAKVTILGRDGGLELSFDRRDGSQPKWLTGPIAGGLEMVLEHVTPESDRVVTALPAAHPILLVPRPEGSMRLTMIGDTLRIDADRGVATIVYRASVALAEGRPPSRLILAIEQEPPQSFEETIAHAQSETPVSAPRELGLPFALSRPASPPPPPAVPPIGLPFSEPPRFAPVPARPAIPSYLRSEAPRVESVPPPSRDVVALSGAAEASNLATTSSKAPASAPESESDGGGARGVPKSPPIELLWKAEGRDAEIDLARSRAGSPKLDRRAAFGRGAEDRPARDLGWLAHATPLSTIETRALLSTPFVVRGVLVVGLSQEEELAGAIASSSALAAHHKPSQGAVAAARAIEIGPFTPPKTIRSAIDRIYEAARALGAETADRLALTVRSSLARRRRFETLDVFGDPHVACHLESEDGKATIPIYVPLPAARRLPLTDRVACRAVVASHPRQDPEEAHPLCLSTLALARDLRPEETGTALVNAAS